MTSRTIAFYLVFALLFISFPIAVAQEEGDAEPLLLARRSGPIIWHVEDEELRRRMENDLELLRLWNEAVAAKRRRKSLGMALFTPGAILVGVGFTAGLFQNAIGLYDQETGDYIMVGGVVLGLALAVPGIYFSAFKSNEEVTYENYLRDTYGVTPILQIDPDLEGFTLGLGWRF